MTPKPPPLRPYSSGLVLAQTAEEAAAFDARAIDDMGVPGAVLMENAGRSAAAVLGQIFPSARRVVGLVGSGNNGGDALVALRSLANWGYDARAILIADRSTEDPLLHGLELECLTDAKLDEAGWAEELGAADVVIDGILGTGVSGAPRERQATAMQRLNRSGAAVLSLDVPSGIDASSGAVSGVAVHATATVSFGAPKLGALLHPAKALVGRHVTVEIGFPPLTAADAGACLATPVWARARVPARGTDTHKNRVGRVLIAGGGVGMAGAVVLSARAAFRAGAGLVRVCSVDENREVIQAAVPEAIFLSAADGDAVEAAVDDSDAVAVGPGLGTGPDARSLLTRIVAAGTASLLLDADALNLAATGAVDLSEVASSRPLLITPHPGEMARLLPGSEAAVEGGVERVGLARAAAARFGCAVLLKGAPSLVASDDQPIIVDTQGSSDLAVAGMGDTLTGACVTLLAQGLDVATAGAVGLYLSGRAAALAGLGAGLTPSDVARLLPEAMAEPASPVTELDLPFITFDADPAR